jgi:hypothetical protein
MCIGFLLMLSVRRMCVGSVCIGICIVCVLGIVLAGVGGVHDTISFFVGEM